MEKSIARGLYLLAFLLPLQTRWIIKAGASEYLTYSLYGTDILLAALLFFNFIYWLLNVFKKQKPVFNEQVNFKFKTADLFIAGLLSAGGLSIFFAADSGLALYKFGWLIAGVGLFGLVAGAAYSRRKLIWSLLAGLGLQAGLAVWQFLGQAGFANKWLGLAVRRAADLGASVIETVGAYGRGERWLRAYGGFDHPNILGGVMALAIILLVGELVRTEKTKTIFNVRIFKLIAWLFLAIFSAALFFSFSRAGWLALAAGLAATMIAALARKNLAAQKNILQAVLISGLVFFILFAARPNLAMTRIYAGGRLENISLGERAESLKNSWPVIKNNWAAGAGLGNYVLALERARPGREI